MNPVTQTNILKDLIGAAVEENLRKLLGEVVEEKLNSFFGKPETAMLSRKETAKELGVSLPTLDMYTRDGTIEAVRIGAVIRYRPEAIVAATPIIKTKKYQRT